MSESDNCKKTTKNTIKIKSIPILLFSDWALAAGRKHRKHFSNRLTLSVEVPCRSSLLYTSTLHHHKASFFFLQCCSQFFRFSVYLSVFFPRCAHFTSSANSEVYTVEAMFFVNWYLSQHSAHQQLSSSVPSMRK